mgnify:CR=1 FL=1|jgi:hypothetical protein
MSSNRLIYDSCAYQKELQQSTDPLDYALYTGKYENSAKCRIELGSVGGNGVSLFNGNLVDLESDLRGQTRQASICPCSKYTPKCHNSKCNNKGKGIPCSSRECQVPLKHQPSCQMINYPKVPMPNKPMDSKCDYTKYH